MTALFVAACVGCASVAGGPTNADETGASPSTTSAISHSGKTGSSAVSAHDPSVTQAQESTGEKTVGYIALAGGLMALTLFIVVAVQVARFLIP